MIWSFSGFGIKKIAVSSSRTITAKFKVESQQIHINGWLNGYALAGTRFKFEADHPTTIDIYITIKSQGWWEKENPSTGRFEEVPFYDDISGSTLRLSAGQKSWEVIYYPGIDSGSSVTSIRWQIVGQTLADGKYTYIVEESFGEE